MERGSSLPRAVVFGKCRDIHMSHPSPSSGEGRGVRFPMSDPATFFAAKLRESAENFAWAVAQVPVCWSVPRNKRPNPIRLRLRSLLLLVTSGAAEVCRPVQQDKCLVGAPRHAQDPTQLLQSLRFPGPLVRQRREIQSCAIVLLRVGMGEDLLRLVTGQQQIAHHRQRVPTGARVVWAMTGVQLRELVSEGVPGQEQRDSEQDPADDCDQLAPVEGPQVHCESA